MSQLLWRLYLEDDVETFCQVLEGSSTTTRTSARKPSAHNALKIGSPGDFSRPIPGAASSLYAELSSPLPSPGGRELYNDVVLGRNDINRRDGKGMTLLHHASSCVAENAIKFALALVAHPLIDLYPQDVENGWTALHRCLYFGNITVARAILEREAQDILGEGQGGVASYSVRLIRVKDREGNGPFDLLTETIMDRTLHPADADLARGSDAGDDEDERNEVISEDGNSFGHANGRAQPLIDLSGDELFTFGSNKNATLGLGNADDRQYPERVRPRRSERLFRRFMREHFEKRASAAGAINPVYAERLRSTAKAVEPSNMPSVIRSKPLRIQDVQMSKFHSAVLTEDPVSNLYMTGHGPGGRLGTGDEQTRFNFTCIEDYAGSRKKIVAIGLGQDHSLAVTDKGELFTWGSNAFGQLGTGLSRTSLNAEEPLQLVPKQLFGQLKKEMVIGVAASRIHSVAHTETSIYTFGKNEGQLGIVDAHAGTLETQSTPRRVAASRFSCGIQSVSAIDRATICLLENHEVHVFTNYGMVKLLFPLDGFTNFFLKETVRSTRYDERPNTIIKVTSGGNTICALSSSGEIFSVTVDQRLDPASSSTSSTTNPNKIRASLSFPIRVWSLKKGHMNARDVGVDQDGSIVLSTEAGSVWRRVKRTNLPVARQQGNKKSKEFKFSRVPGMTRVIAVRASGSGAYCAVRHDSDVTRTQIMIQPRTLWTDVYKLLPFKNIEALEADKVANPASRFWSRPSPVQRLSACLVGLEDVEKDLEEVLQRQPNEYCSQYDATVGSTVSDVKIPVHTIFMACRSPVILDALATAQRTGSWDCEVLSVSISDQGRTSFTFKGVDILTLIEIVLYVYTDEFVGYWLRSREALHLAHRYRQVRVEVMKVAGRLEMRNLESAARRMATSGPQSLHLDFELALAHWSFLDSGDAVIQLSDGEQLVHSDLLSRRCPFFEGMFQGRAAGQWLAQRRQMLDDDAEAVTIDFTHVELSTFRIVLRHLYTDAGEELFDETACQSLDEFLDVVLDVLSLANELMLDRLSEVCQKVLGRHVNIRNVCSLLNAVAPSAVSELKSTALEYICLNLEALLTTQLLDELDDDLLLELDKVVRDNQLSTLPFAKSGRAEALLLERHPELVARLDRDRQARIDAVALQAKQLDYFSATGISFRDEEDELPLPKTRTRNRNPAVNRSPNLTATPRSPRVDPIGSSIPASPSLLSPQGQQRSTSAIAAPVQDISLGQAALAGSSTEDARRESLPHRDSTIGTGPKSWAASPMPTKIGLKEMLNQAPAARKSGIALGLATQAKADGSAAGITRVSQKERRRQQQQQTQQLAENRQPFSSSSSALSQSAPKSPWQTVAKAKPVPVGVPMSPSPSPSPKPLTPRSNTPQLTMRQTVANPPSGSKPKQPLETLIPETPPDSKRSASVPQLTSPSLSVQSPQPSSSTTKPVGIQSIRHTPKPDSQISPTFLMHQSMADVIAQQAAEKTAVKEAVAKRSLQEIQQEQEFLSWWDAESRRAKEEAIAASRAATSKSRGGGARRGQRGPRRGKGKEQASSHQIDAA